MQKLSFVLALVFVVLIGLVGYRHSVAERDMLIFNTASVNTSPFQADMCSPVVLVFALDKSGSMGWSPGYNSFCRDKWVEADYNGSVWKNFDECSCNDNLGYNNLPCSLHIARDFLIQDLIYNIPEAILENTGTQPTLLHGSLLGGGWFNTKFSNLQSPATHDQTIIKGDSNLPSRIRNLGSYGSTEVAYGFAGATEILYNTKKSYNIEDAKKVLIMITDRYGEANPNADQTVDDLIVDITRENGRAQSAFDEIIYFSLITEGSGVDPAASEKVNNLVKNSWSKPAGNAIFQDFGQLQARLDALFQEQCSLINVGA